MAHPPTPIQWVPGALSQEIKQPRREADHTPPYSDEVTNAWSCISIPLHLHVAVLLVRSSPSKMTARRLLLPKSRTCSRSHVTSASTSHNDIWAYSYHSPCKCYVVQVEMGGACSTYGRDVKYKSLFGKPEGKRPFGRPTRRWEDNITMDPKEIGRERVVWMHLAQDRDQ